MKSAVHLPSNSAAALVAVLVTFVLTVLKFAVGMLTGSLAIIASAVDSLLDLMMTVMNFFTIHAAAQPPDADHRYGHGKFEAFASLIQAIFIVVSGIFLALESAKRILTPVELNHELYGLLVMGFSMCASALLAYYLQSVVRKTTSLVLKAEAANFRADTLANGAVVIGLLVISQTQVAAIDAMISLLISAFILHSAWGLLVESYDVLTDRELPDETRQEIIGIIESLSTDRVNGWHHLRTRRAGSQLHIDFHLFFDADISLYDAHEICDEIEIRLRERFLDAAILVHLDPGHSPSPLKESE